MVTFIRYTGTYPNLCTGTLVIDVDGVEYNLKYVLNSGGTCKYSTTGLTKAPWFIIPKNLPLELQPLREEIENIVNLNVEYGCCSGCPDGNQRGS